MITLEFVESLEYSWTAGIEYHNGFTGTIWWTAFPMSKSRIKSILWIASDYPKFKLKKDFLIS